MLRRNGSGKLSSTSGNSFSQREDVNPMATVANLVDAMLVLAVGIMLALILSWNVTVSETGEINKSGSNATYEIDGLDGAVTQEIDANTQLQEMGTVYMDPETGKYYVMAE